MLMIPLIKSFKAKIMLLSVCGKKLAKEFIKYIKYI
jgi:hypothetical protein